MTPTLTKTERFLDRDLSLLEFNRRVLLQALDERVPLLERVFFLGILTSNLDEFFMKRVSSLYREGEVEDRARLQQYREIVMQLQEQQASCYQNQIREALTKEGIHLLGWARLEPDEVAEATRYFKDNVYPVLTPQAVDSSHPFPFISNLSDSLVIRIRDPQDNSFWFARLKIPPQLPQWIELNASGKEQQRRFIALRELIQQNLSQLFTGMVLEDVLPIRVTRSAVVESLEEDTGGLLEQVEGELRQRRQQFAVRMEHPPDPDPWLLDRVTRELNLSPEQIYPVAGELDYTDLRSIATLAVKDLRFPVWRPRLPVGLENPEKDIFAAVRQSDVFLHHPYDDFDASVSRFIRSAVEDEQVLAIKMTLYRTSDDTPFVPWLIEAAESGKQVACLVELKARFDEHRNIRWANALGDAGVNVVYGVMGKKTHTKCILIVRREGDRVRSYAHIGTGNYHPGTARLYTDMGLLTCNPELTEEVARLFHYLTGRSHESNFPQLLIAPMNMKSRFLDLIDAEVEHHKAGRSAGITAKMNQLEDRDIIEALYRASCAGVPINLIIRGFCVLRPATKGLSPTIRVISIIGRFLEHSRVFHFHAGAKNPLDGAFFLGSADWMHRNLKRRIEAITPVFDRSVKKRLWYELGLMMEDQNLAWEMQSDGSYQRLDSPAASHHKGSHQALMEMAAQRPIPPERTQAVRISGQA